METCTALKTNLARMAASLLRRAGIAAFAAAIAAAGLHGAQAAKKLNETGTFDCSCKGGSGTCTFESSTDNTACYKGVGATCSGSCTLKITKDNAVLSVPKAAIGAGKATTTIKRK